MLTLMNGNTAAWLSIGEDGPKLLFEGDTGVPRVELLLRTVQRRRWFKNGRTGVEAKPLGPILAFYDETGTTTLGLSDSTPSLVFTDINGHRLLDMAGEKLRFTDSESNIIWQAPPEE